MNHSGRASNDESMASYNVEERLLTDEKNENASGYGVMGQRRTSLLRYWRESISSMIMILVLLCSNIILSILLFTQSQDSQFGTFERGFTTDMGPAKIAMEAVRIPFTGELKRHPNGSLYRDMPGPQYFGEPTKEIDHNWSRLLYASGLELNEHEIEQTGLKETTWEEPQGGIWRTGLDVFHQLHCLDMVRKSFYPEYYKMTHDDNIDDPPRLRNMHRDHCLDYIRQAIMCNADSTPVRLQWDYQAHFLIPKFDQLHTCRNFELLHSWGRARALEKTHDESTRLINKMKESGTL